MAKINLTPIFEQIFGVSEIDSEEKLNLLITALEEMGDRPFSDKFTLEELAQKIEENKAKQ